MAAFKLTHHIDSDTIVIECFPFRFELNESLNIEAKRMCIGGVIVIIIITAVIYNNNTSHE